MTQNGDPRENAIAERINGIIKNEYLGDARLIRYSERIEKLINAVHLYNTARPHLSLNYHTPEKGLAGIPSDVIKRFRAKKCKIIYQ
ncbi:MAG: hypothetical protein EBV74_05500 [Alphaproteobacteria bacterium]|nr:hypothetical protein [Candidatus Fonsibacter sp. PEL55]